MVSVTFLKVCCQSDVSFSCRRCSYSYLYIYIYYFFFSELPFYGNHSTLDSHANTVISHAVAYSQDGFRNLDKVYYF